mmetsp:Transcript_19488/g.40147  ORF Transcript_19488/g.40147 Transcript_19488/m.40147 type:complete len:501 (-) Transcript_19488:39-1541(-)
MISIITEIGLLTNLKLLEVAYNEIKIIPSEIGLLSNLWGLKVAYNNITSIPSEMLANAKFTTLDMNYNKITSVPSDIGLLTNLRELKLGYNQIKAIPTAIGTMSMLEKLFMEYNRIEAIPSEIGLLTELGVLELTNNEIRSIPSEIGLMANLTSLVLAYNLITSIPIEIQSMTSLKRIDLRGNPIETLPSEIGLLTNLEEILILDGGVASIPTEIELMTDLEVIDYDVTAFPRCNFAVRFDDCPVGAGIELRNDCVTPLQVVTFEYVGADCKRFISRRSYATCEDFNGGPHTEEGSVSYITAVSNRGEDLHYEGYVRVGDSFTLNENKTFDSFSDDLRIEVFSRQGGDLLQVVNLDLSCNVDSIFLYDPLGAIEIKKWTEADGREVFFMLDKGTFVRATFDMSLIITAYSSEPIRITEADSFTTAGTFSTAAWMKGRIIQPGAPSIVAPGAYLYAHDDYSYSAREYYHFVAVVAETLDGEAVCNAHDTLVCSGSRNKGWG